MKFQVFEDLNLVVSLLEGVVTDQDTEDLLKAIGKAPNFKSSMSYMGDFRFITSNLITPAGMTRTAQFTPFDRTSQRVYLVNDEMVKILSVIYASVANISQNYYLTRDIDDGCKRLGISPDKIKQSELYQKQTSNEVD